MKRILTLLISGLIGLLILTGCSHNEAGVDKPLMTNAPPTPPRPDKPTVTPSGGGGATQSSKAPP